MARKRLAKKASRQQAEVEQTLLRLHERGADRELLAVARRRLGEPARSAVAGLYLEAVDRTLGSALAAADLDPVDGLLAELSPLARQRPLASLAAAVAALRHGREAAAASILEGLASAPAGAPAGVAEASRQLLVVARQPPPARRGHPPRCPVREAHPSVAALYRLRQALGRLPWQPEAPLPPLAAGPGEGLAQALWQAARAVAVIARGGYRPTRRQLADLATAARALRDATPAARALAEALDARRAELRELGARLEGVRRGDLAEVRRVTALVEAGGLPRLPGPAPGAGGEDHLTLHLDHALRLRWRELLGLLLASPAVSHERLGRLLAAWSGGGEGWVEGAAAPADGRRGIGREEALDLLVADEDYLELAAALAAVAARERDPARLAALWGVELEAIWRTDDDWPPDDDLPADAETWFDAPDQRLRGPCARLLARLAEMARDLLARFPAEQQPATARLLRDQLLMIARQVELADPALQRAVRRVAAALPEDVIALALQYAACEAAESLGEARRTADRLRALPAVRNMAQGALELLVAALAEEHHDILVHTLEAVRPLVPAAAWESALEAGREAALWTCLTLLMSPLVEEAPDLARRVALERLEAFVPWWGGSAQLEAVRLLVARLGCPSSDDVASFLARFPRLDHALFFAGAVVPFAEESESFHEAALQPLATFVADHLELPVSDWVPEAMLVLTLCMRAGQDGRLARRLRQLAKRCQPDGADSVALERLALTLEAMRHGTREITRLPSVPRSPDRRQPQRRRRERPSPPAPPEPPPGEQLELGLWGDDEP